MANAPRRPFSARGFTLIELMIVVAVISVLTLIAVPRFSNMIRKANESGSRGHLGSMRAAIRLYYMENDQVFPSTFDALRLAGAKYYSGSIPLYTGYHPVGETVDDMLASDATDAGHWGYVMPNPTPTAEDGHFWVRCSHADAAGRRWSSY